VLPGAILFALLGCFVIHLVAMVKFYFSPADGANFLGFIQFDNLKELEYAMYALINPAIFILSAVYIAPSKKLIVAYIMAFMLVCTITGVYMILKDSPTFSTSSFGANTILNFISIVIALIVSHVNKKEVTVNI